MGCASVENLDRDWRVSGSDARCLSRGVEKEVIVERSEGAL